MLGELQQGEEGSSARKRNVCEDRRGSQIKKDLSGGG